MFVLFFLFTKNIRSEEQSNETEVNYDNDKSLFQPPVLSDFITARQSRNLTVKGQKELEPIVGRYFRKPLVNLLQGVQPSVLNFRRLYFTNFDGMILKGESNCLAKFPDIMIVDCTFKAANQHPIHINGPAYKDEAFDPDASVGNVKD
ncbi:hypothetical protein TVAG_499450 [Trichomonas vaginalis G3]|uniref:Uncharacterized protein n=1 Tax=Trichomonas vaginalis (strain ATCC PRA-98 / G3) TaxID=412133 RepID=A2EIN2_TRIV3|nr:hypothetical protein TVAGG3_0960140 [Trichomonas vaginalis G3]EAY07459.1 hypothetical protein TVAG_499450 [Trichomonas vaginalis G3]KAI5487845.1 hypothetical protein TVAGG3_0960140 [Trichomonas vaginalis G3]|eukprot:XP_001319682.1 hypothetical protein [Trichomonas vaginalis G3]